jgi:hypothetical protein
MPNFRIIILDDLSEIAGHFAKSEIAKELSNRLDMLGYNVSLRDGRKLTSSCKAESKGNITIDVLEF